MIVGSIFRTDKRPLRQLNHDLEDLLLIALEDIYGPSTKAPSDQSETNSLSSRLTGYQYVSAEKCDEKYFMHSTVHVQGKADQKDATLLVTYIVSRKD